MVLINRSAHFSRRKAKCYCPLQFIAILLFCVTWAAAALTIAISVGVGDVCMEPLSYTTEAVNHHASSFDQVTHTYISASCFNGVPVCWLHK
jgi:hypothetical protein